MYTLYIYYIYIHTSIYIYACRFVRKRNNCSAGITPIRKLKCIYYFGGGKHLEVFQYLLLLFVCKSLTWKSISAITCRKQKHNNFNYKVIVTALKLWHSVTVNSYMNGGINWNSFMHIYFFAFWFCKQQSTLMHFRSIWTVIAI